MPIIPKTQAKITNVQHPSNLSDYAMVYGSQVAGILAFALNWDEGLLLAIVAGCQGLIMASLMLVLGLTMTGQPPAVFKRIWNGEPLDP